MVTSMLGGTQGTTVGILHPECGIVYFFEPREATCSGTSQHGLCFCAGALVTKTIVVHKFSEMRIATGLCFLVFIPGASSRFAMSFSYVLFSV